MKIGNIIVVFCCVVSLSIVTGDLIYSIFDSRHLVPIYKVGDCFKLQLYNDDEFDVHSTFEIIYQVEKIGKKHYLTKFGNNLKEEWNFYIDKESVKTDCIAK